MDFEEDVNLDADGGDERNEAENDEYIIFEEDNSDEEEQPFDITLPALHSYMVGLSEMGGRVVLEAGWTGRVPVAAHHGCVFPGETVPMLFNNPHDAAVIAKTIAKDKLFGLLCPDEKCETVSGYGVVCEVFSAALAPGAGAAAPPALVTFKARAVHRFRLKDMPKRPLPVALLSRLRPLDVVVLPEVALEHPLRHARLACLDARRKQGSDTQQSSAVRRLDAALTPWPGFVFQIFDFKRMRDIIRDYFQTLGLERMLPEEAVRLSFWAASNLPLAPRDRLALFVVDNALLRLHMECRFIERKSVLCCAACGAETARREHAFAMSSDGVTANYTNMGGFLHDVVTVSRATNTQLSGAPSAAYSWFPGYAWSVALCAGCMAHVGWRFDALRRSLRPQQFYALCRNSVQPRDSSRSPPPDPLL